VLCGSLLLIFRACVVVYLPGDNQRLANVPMCCCFTEHLTLMQLCTCKRLFRVRSLTSVCLVLCLSLYLYSFCDDKTQLPVAARHYTTCS